MKKKLDSVLCLIFDVIWTYIRSYCKWVPTWKWVHEKSYPGKCENSWDIKDPHPARVFNYYPWIWMVIVENIGYKKYRSYHNRESMIATNKMAMIMLMLPQRGKVMTAPTVPPLKANVTNFPFSDSGTHLKEMFQLSNINSWWRWRSRFQRNILFSLH